MGLHASTYLAICNATTIDCVCLDLKMVNMNSANWVGPMKPCRRFVSNSAIALSMTCKVFILNYGLMLVSYT